MWPLLLAVRTFIFHHVADQIARLPTEIRYSLVQDGKVETWLRLLKHVDASTVSTLGWLVAFVDQDRSWRREIRCLESELDALLDEHDAIPRGEGGIGPIAAATLTCEVGDRHASIAHPTHPKPN